MSDELKEYTATAGNLYFYQKLVVLARDIDDATDRFRAFLADNRKEEEEEYRMGCKAYEDGVIGGRFPQREDYAYDVRDDAVEENYYHPHWSGKATLDVQIINSGGNG